MTERKVSSERVSEERLREIIADFSGAGKTTGAYLSQATELVSLASELLALRSSVKTVVVKKLEWAPFWRKSPEDAERVYAKTLLGVSYHASSEGWWFPLCELHPHSSLEEAKAAAQSDYEQRILSAIEAPAAEGEQIDKTLLHGICDSLRAVIMEYEDMDMFPGSRAIMQGQLDALTAALKGDRS